MPLARILIQTQASPTSLVQPFCLHLLQLGFVEAKSNISLFVFHQGANTTYLLLYMHDIVLMASSMALLRRIISALQQEFSMDLGELHHFLGMHVQRIGSGLFLSQRQYMLGWLSASRVSLLLT